MARRLLRIIGIAAIAVLIIPAAINMPLVAQRTSGQSSQAGLPDWQIAAGKRLSFEVATVKPGTPDGEPRVNFTMGPGDAYAKTGGRLLASNISLLDYIRFAYKLTDGQAQILQANAPNWIVTKKFDIEAKAENPDATKDQIRLMMQSLLAERFGLKIHAEMRELPVLALVLAKPGRLGPQLRPHAVGDETCSNVAAGGEESSEGKALAAIPAVCGGIVSVGGASSPSHVRIGGRKVSIALIAAHFGEMAGFDRPVVDGTGLKGTYDFVLEWGPDAVAADAANRGDEDARQTQVEEALRDQLGLKLEREKAAVEVLLIDHVDELPVAN